MLNLVHKAQNITSKTRNIFSGIFIKINTMSDKRRLVFSIIQFCQKELQSEELSDDAKESLEVRQKF